MGTKRFLIMFVFMILLVNTVSAFDFDNVKSFDDGQNKITIKNAFGLGDTLAEYTLKFNTDQCLTDCRAEGIATLYEKDYLFREADFLDKKLKKKDLPFNIYYRDLNKTKEIEIPTYNETCEVLNNGTGDYEVCSKEQNGSYIIEVSDLKWNSWKPNKKLEVGTYEWRIIGNKEKKDSIDWSVAMYGITTDEIREHWAWWDNSWTHKRQYNLTESLDSSNNQNRSEMWHEVITNLDVTNCTNEIRVLDSTETLEIPSYAIHINNTACDVYFKHEKNDSTTNTIYYIYYTNPSASFPNYITNMSESSNLIINKNYNITYENNPIGSNYNQNWFYDTILMEGVNSGNISSGSNLGLWLSPQTTSSTQQWNYNVTINNSVLIRFRVASLNNDGFYNLTFFHDVDQWKYDSFESFPTSDSGFRGFGRFGSGKDKCIYYRTGNDTYTKNCGEIGGTTLTPNSYWDFNVNGETENIFTTFTNSSGDPDTDYKLTIYLRDGDVADPQLGFPSAASNDAQSNLNLWDNLYSGKVSNNNDTREEKFWTLRSPPVSSLGEEEVDTSSPVVTLNNPSDDEVFNTQTITFNCSSIDTSVVNISLFIDSSLNYTVTNTTADQTYIDFEIDLSVPEGDHNWTCIASDSDSLTGTTSTYDFTIDLTNPDINITNPTNKAHYEEFVTTNLSTVFFNWSYTEFNPDSCYYNVDSDVILSNTLCLQEFANVSTSCGGLSTGNYVLDGSFGSSEVNNLYDGNYNTYARRGLLSPPGTDYFYINYTKPSSSINQVIWTVKDFNSLKNITLPNRCINNTLQLKGGSSTGTGSATNVTWFCYNSSENWEILNYSTTHNEIYEEAIIWVFGGINGTEVTCSDNTTQINITYSPHTIYFFMNDSSNNNATDNVSFNWGYYFFLKAQSFINNTLEGVTNNFNINGSSYKTLSIATLVYNNTNNVGTFTQTDDTVTINEEKNSPLLTTETNFPFYWNLKFSDNHEINTTTYNQTVSNISIDGCNVSTFQLFNFTYTPEENVSDTINVTDENTTIELTIELYQHGTDNLITNFSDTYNQINPVDVCINTDLNDTIYDIDLIVEYESDDRVNEFFQYDNYSINGSDLYQNISLYGLHLTDSTSFVITYTDENNLKVSDVIVSVLRYYTGDGIYREVERPKTNNLGEAIAHLLEEDVIYKFNLTKYNQPLFISDEYRVYCESTTAVCTINLKTEGTVDDFDDNYDNLENGTYYLSSNSSTRLVTLSFKLDTPSLMNLSVYRYNNESDQEFINDSSLNATSGSINVYIPLEYGNSSYYVKIFEDNSYISSRWIGITDRDPRDLFDDWMPFLVALIILSLGLLAIASGFGVIIFSLLGLILSIILNLVYVPYTTLIFIIVAGLIIIWKLIQKRGRL